jgi:hypothetical protein
MKQNNQLDMLLEQKVNSSSEKSPENKKVYIRYYLAKTIRPANLQEMIDDLFILSETLKKNDTLYIIIKDHPNETLVNELKHIWERDGIFIVIESIKCLQFNILNHSFVPMHVVMNPNEVSEIMSYYNILDYVYDSANDISTFKAPITVIDNPFYVNLNNNVNLTSNTIGNLPQRYLDYTLFFNDINYGINGFTGFNSSNSSYLYFSINGNPFSGDSTPQNISDKFIIKPNPDHNIPPVTKSIFLFQNETN